MPNSALKIYDEDPAVVLTLPKKALINRPVDFWFLGGVSFVAWIFSQAAFYGNNLNDGFDRNVLTWPYAFSALTLICNYPHFMSSYRIAYGNGLSKIKSHWFQLLLVPVLLAALFIAAYFYRGREVAQSANLGADLLRGGIWLMWVTVGWHYAKQSFGIMLRYAKFDSYPLTAFQKNLVRYSLLAVVPVNFIAMIAQMTPQTPDFQDLSMVVFEVPKLVLSASYWTAGIFAASFAGMLVWNAVRLKRYPSINFVTPFAAFYLWWFPGFWPQPYCMIMIPFFHSLQYLPFAYHRIKADLSPEAKHQFARTVTLNIAVMLVAGFLLFDVVPAYLDSKYLTRFEFGSSFFLISGVLFLNIHHFFLDSAIWRSPAKRVN